MIHFSPRVWQLAWPMILSNISIPLLGIVDTAMVGHLPWEADIAAVALGAMAFDLIFWSFGFLRMSTTGLAAQEQGDNSIFYQSTSIALLISLLLILFASPIKQLALLCINTDPVVEAKFASYFILRIFSSPATLLNYVIFGFFFGRQNTRVPLVLMLITNVLAMFLDYLFVWVWNYGAAGIAIANVIAQSVGALMGFIIIFQLYLRHQQIPPLDRLFNRKRIKRLFQLNSDIFIRTLCLLLTLAFFTRQGAAMGVSVVAANAILMHFQMIMSYALDGFAIAAESLCGKAIGEGSWQEFKTQFIECAKWSGLIMGCFVLLFATAGKFAINLMSSIKSIQILAYNYLPWIVILPILSTPGFLLDGVYIGATWTKSLRNTMLVATIIVFFPLWYLTKAFSNTGLWVAYCGFMLARSVYLSIDFYKRLCKINTM
jgi:MATE family multidrug resistance protein